MITRKTPVLVMAGLLVLTSVAIPAADARPTCQNTDSKTVCQTNGSVSIKARPAEIAAPVNHPHVPWLGQPGRRRR